MGTCDGFGDGGERFEDPTLIEDSVGANIDDMGLTLPLTNQSRSRSRDGSWAWGGAFISSVRRQNNLDELGFRIAESLAHLG